MKKLITRLAGAGAAVAAVSLLAGGVASASSSYSSSSSSSSSYSSYERQVNYSSYSSNNYYGNCDYGKSYAMLYGGLYNSCGCDMYGTYYDQMMRYY